MQTPKEKAIKAIRNQQIYNIEKTFNPPYMNNTNDKIREKLYSLMDSFLVEAKNQNGEERSLEQLNIDRHLFVDNMMELFATQKKEIIEMVKKVEEKEPESNGRYNACQEIITKLKEK